MFFGAQLTALYGTTNVFGRDDGTRLLVYPFPISLAGWGAPGHVLPEGLVPLPRVTITIGPEARTPRVYQVSGGVTRVVGRVDGGVGRRRVSPGRNQLGVLEYNPLVSALGPGRRPNDVAGIAGTSTNVVAVHRLRRDVVSRAAAVGDAALRRPAATLRVSYTWSSAEDNVSRFAGQVDDNGPGPEPRRPVGLPLGFDPDARRARPRPTSRIGWC